VCTLRAAIEEANAHAGPDTINFSVAGTITSATVYPAIAGQTTIDGTTAPGYAGAPVVVIDGAASVAIGLSFAAGSSSSGLTGLKLMGFSDTAVRISSSDVTITRNYLGPIPSGTPNQDGIQIAGSSANDSIGGADGFGNVISGNSRFGILVGGSGHWIRDNVIGADPGIPALGNGDDGIRVSTIISPSNIFIGSGVAVEPNLIAGNGDDGIEIIGNGVTVTGNHITENNLAGVFVTGDNNNIGSPGVLTLISGNGEAGVAFFTGSGNVVQACYIGVDATGTAAFPNGLGVDVYASDNTVGTPTDGNVISGNDFHGIRTAAIGPASNITIQGNIIGLSADGTTGIGNGDNGITANEGSNLVIGGTGAGEGNVISFNAGGGIVGDTISNSRIEGNTIGLNSARDTILGNFAGVVLLDADNVRIGAPGNGMNVISGNFVFGVLIDGGLNNIVQNNRIGTNGAGDSALGNGDTGVIISATDAAIVRTNLISGNGLFGAEVTFGSTNAVVHSNTIGRSLDLSTAIPNVADGVNVCDTASGTVVGSIALGGNVISGNGGNGIGVETSALLNNTFIANSIYENDFLGIDLEEDGVTPNDAMDPDTGANNLQNFPVLAWAVTNGTQTSVQGSLNSTPSSTFALHFYSNLPADGVASEGRTYLGTTGVTTDVSGDGAFIFNGPAAAVGQFITATATATDGTSEFSAALAVIAAPTVQFSAQTYSVAENGTSVTITVTRTGDLTGTSTVNYATSNGTATTPADYASASGTLTFGPTVSSQTFIVTIVNDAIDETNETVTLTLSSPGAASLGVPSTAVLTINDDDPTPSITINDVTQNEGNAGATGFVFTVMLSNPSSSTITVDFGTANGTAIAGSDYSANSGMLTFMPNVLTQTITVNVNGDTMTETNETFFVNLTNATNATIADNQGLGTITNDDAPPSITISDVTQNEGNAGSAACVFLVTLSNPSASTVTVDFATANGSATAGSDYTAANSTLNFAPGVLTQPITVNVTGDLTSEPNETFFVNLTNPTNASIADNQGLGTIVNDDGIPSITITDVTQIEGNTGTGAFTFTVMLSNPSASTVTVDFATADGTAIGGSDYSATNGTLTFAPTVVTQTIIVTVNGDITAEPDETFFVNLTNATNASIADNQGLGIITNDDGMMEIPTLSEWLLLALAAMLALVATMRL